MSDHTSTAPKHSQSSASKSADDAVNGKSSASSKSSAAGSSADQAAADARSARDGSSAEHAAAANSASGGSATNGVSKSRAGARATLKSGAQAAGAKSAGNAIDNPGADASNQSGMSLLQLLAQSLKSDDSATPEAHASATSATDKPADGSTATTNSDPNAMALAMFTQALAAALGASAAPQQGAPNTATATAGNGIGDLADATLAPKGALMQDLASLLAQTITADAKGKSDAAAAQLGVDPTKGAASDASTPDTATAGPASSADLAFAHLGFASHLSTQQTQSNTSVSDLKSPVGSAAWHDELGSQLTWMTQNGLESGSLRVTPEHLGPVEVQISVQNGAASVWFGASHPDTRAALEQALPQLRAMFASQGMSLTDSGVSRESPRNQGKSQAQQSVSAVSAVGSADVSTAAAVRMSLGLVDTYA